MVWIGIAVVASAGWLVVTHPEVFTNPTDDVRKYEASGKKAGSWGYVLLLVAGIWALMKLII